MPPLWIEYPTWMNPITNTLPIYYPVWQNQTGSTSNCWPPWQSQTISNLYINVANGTPYVCYYPSWHDNITMPAIIRERSEADLEQLSIRQTADAEIARIRKVAADRAKEVLLEHLTPQQRETVEKHGWFTIEGGKSKKLYRIIAGGVAGNIEELDAKGEKAMARYCCHLDGSYPASDHHLTQKLMLEWDEETFLKLANKTPLVA
jgi:hypothetical protein